MYFLSNLAFKNSKETKNLIAPDGLIEISGTDVSFTGTVDTRAADGSVGTFLLDPKDILIQIYRKVFV